MIDPGVIQFVLVACNSVFDPKKHVNHGSDLTDHLPLLGKESEFIAEKPSSERTSEVTRL